MRYLLLLLITFNGVNAFANEFTIEKCFSRTYSKRHLAKNPKQKVSGIRLAFYKDNFSTTLYTNLNFKLKGHGETIEASVGGSCDSPASGLYLCRLDEDRGSFSVKLRKDKALIKVTSLLTAEEISVGANSEENIIIRPGKENGIFELDKDEMSHCSVD